MVQGKEMTSIRVNGFYEVFENGTAEVELPSGHYFKAATLPAIVLLKLISYNDRPERRLKDPGDIAGIIINYFHLQADHVYEHHVDLFEDQYDSLNTTETGAIVIGREIKMICISNEELRLRLIKIIETELQKSEDSAFLRLMVNETKKSLEEMQRLLTYVLKGLT